VTRRPLLALVLAGLTAATAARAGNDFVIVAGGPRDQQRIGPYAFASTRTAGRSYPAAIEAFGRPTSRGTDTRAQRDLCTVRWTRLGLETTFESKSSDPCSTASLSQSVWFGATIHARPWQTDKGLRVGDTVAKLHRLYPKARYSDRPPGQPAWALVFVRGEVGLTVYLQAFVWGGHVAALDLPPGNVSVGR
jgi:hypothetical protein